MSRRQRIVSVLHNLEDFTKQFQIRLGDTVFHNGQKCRVIGINLLEDPISVVVDKGVERVPVESVVLDGE